MSEVKPKVPEHLINSNFPKKEVIKHIINKDFPYFKEPFVSENNQNEEPPVLDESDRKSEVTVDLSGNRLS